MKNKLMIFIEREPGVRTFIDYEDIGLEEAFGKLKEVHGKCRYDATIKVLKDGRMKTDVKVGGGLCGLTYLFLSPTVCGDICWVHDDGCVEEEVVFHDNGEGVVVRNTYFIDLDKAINAIRYFYVTKDVDPRLKWRVQN